MDLTKICLNNRVECMDFNSINDFMYIDENSNIYRNIGSIEVKDIVFGLSPMIKIISEDLFVLINRDGIKNSNNCWIINNEGSIKSTFFIGSPQEIIATKDYIIVSYSNSMLDSNSVFGDAQIVVFDFKGNIIFKYNSESNKTKFPFLENKSFVKKDEDTIFFMPYGDINSKSDFSIIEFSLIDFSSKILFHLPNFYNKEKELYLTAFTRKGSYWYFFDQNITEWSSNKIGNYNVYQLNFDNQYINKLEVPELSIKPIINLIEEGFSFLSFPDINETKNTYLNYITI